MSHAYRVSVYRDNEDTFVTRLDCGDSLESDLDDLRSFVKEFVTRPIGGEVYENMGVLSISITGPFDSATLATLELSPEERLEQAESLEDRICSLGQAAKGRLEKGDLEGARAYAIELQDWASKSTDHPLNGGAQAECHIVLGRIAMKEGRMEDAKSHLQAAGNVPGSPTLNTFGPNMSLARELLLVGEQSAVISYLESCRTFWLLGHSDLDKWIQDIRVGRIPEFGANLVY